MKNGREESRPYEIIIALVGTGFCLSEMKNNHHAILWSPPYADSRGICKIWERHFAVPIKYVV